MQSVQSRSPEVVKEDILARGFVDRDDIVQLIVQFESKGKAERELRDFFNGFDAKTVGYKGNKQSGIERIISDLSSYKNWERP